MGFDLRYPNITGVTEREQLSQVKGYLHQLVEQLQWALNNLSTSSSGYVVNTAPRSQGGAAANAASVASFSETKSLVIKTAEIVEACYEEVCSRLEGVYVAESDFGVYSERTTQDIIKTSTDVEQLFTNIQTILTDIENIEHTLIETNAHIRSGILYYDEDEIPIYGLEIGQRNIVDGVEVFNKYARFTADRLSFYDQNDTEVAYISDRKLYIAHVEITGSYKIGGLCDYTRPSGSVVTKWIG